MKGCSTELLAIFVSISKKCKNNNKKTD